uniref:Uncharacterized protein n=1 Tax=Anguilla anguilla TaxID=7936 RepID=A0A0E9XUG6_ANGAN
MAITVSCVVVSQKD